MEIIEDEDVRRGDEILATLEGRDMAVISSRRGKQRYLVDGRGSWFFPDTSGRKVIFVAGASGSGKSSFIRNYALAWKRTHDDAKVYIFSSKDEDPSLDRPQRPDFGVIPGKLSFRQVPLDEQNIDQFDEKNIQHIFADSLVIFDDVMLTNKKFQDRLDRLLSMLMKLGRQSGISVIVSRHQLQEQRNKAIKEESQGVVVFPGRSFKMHIRNYLKQIGVDPHVAKEIVDTPDRWIYIASHAPLFAVSPSKIFLLDDNK